MRCPNCGGTGKNSSRDRYELWDDIHCIASGTFGSMMSEYEIMQRKEPDRYLTIMGELCRSCKGSGVR